MMVLINSAEQVVRSSCTTLPLLGEKGHDIRSCTAELGAAMVNELQHDATVYGISVQRISIVEARYAQEISAQMLMKQQASAMVEARKSECAVPRGSRALAGARAAARQAVVVVAVPCTRRSWPRPTRPAARPSAAAAIVAGALGIVRDALQEFPSLSIEAKERLVNNLLVTLTSHQSAAAVIPLST